MQLSESTLSPNLGDWEIGWEMEPGKNQGKGNGIGRIYKKIRVWTVAGLQLFTLLHKFKIIAWYISSKWSSID